MIIDNQTLAALLLRGNYITHEDLARSEEFTRARRGSLIDFLLQENLITKSILGQALAESLGMPYADLAARPPSQHNVLQIPEIIARTHNAVLFSKTDQEVVVATSNPIQAALRQKLAELFPRVTITGAYALPDEVEKLFIHYRRSLQARFVDIAQRDKRIAPEIIQEILNDAVALRASDVHFEPQEKEVVIRFRIDGVLNEVGRFSMGHYENVLNRFKVHGGMRIDEHRSAQDGAIRAAAATGPVDIRISIIPTTNGEKMVIRILSRYVEELSLANLGLSEEDQRKLIRAAGKPFGMILVTGPTGSGKTTTLYALLKILNAPDVNITTIEDPAEYKVAGINQIQVDAQTNLTFAQGLRSIVRQDPDIILVGEIRDGETAEIGVNASLTGHLLLSTFHANDAATAAVRLLEMGIEPFLLASTLELIVAQRLVRRICTNCRYSYRETRLKLESNISGASRYFPRDEVTLYKGKGCDACGGTGYKGRIAIFELIEVTQPLQELLLGNPSSQKIWERAREEGARSLFEDGIEKVNNGVTTIDELLRVAPPKP